MDGFLVATAVSFAVIFVAELGDKSQLMAMTFATRFKTVPVLIGITVATACNVFSGVINHNGDDAYTLDKGGVVVDAFGQVGLDPGVGWGVAGSGLVTNDATLRRKAPVFRGSVPPASPVVWDLGVEWEAFPNNTLDGLGSR